MKKLLINSSFWTCIVFSIYVIASTAYFNRLSYEQGVLWFGVLLMVYILGIVNFIVIGLRKNFRLLIPINILFMIFMIKELMFSKQLHEGVIYPNIMVTEFKHNNDREFKYRLYVENFYQSNSNFYLHIVPYSNQGTEKLILLKDLEDNVERFLMYLGKEYNQKSSDGHRMFPSSVGFLLKDEGDNLRVYANFNTNDIIVYSVDKDSKTSRIVKVLCGNIFGDTITDCNK